MFSSFVVSVSTVCLAEIGDKTQLLSLMLAARYQKPWPIVGGVLVATVLNHAMAGGLGVWLADALNPVWLHWIVVASLFFMAGWILVPDKLDDNEGVVSHAGWGVFATTVATFFLAEMGDKTQIVTIALAARYQDFIGVVLGSTCGMMLANLPAIYCGQKCASRMPTKIIRYVASALIFGLAVFALTSVPPSVPLGA